MILVALTLSLTCLSLVRAACGPFEATVNGVCTVVVAAGAVVDEDQSAYNDESNIPENWPASQVRKRALPASLNWNPVRNGVPTRALIKNQKSCGSCTVYAAVTTIEIWASYFAQLKNPAAPPVVLNTLNQVHCLQRRVGNSKMICSGNKPDFIHRHLQDMQEELRRGKVVGALNVDTTDDQINGAFYALPDACVESSGYDARVPILSPASPVNFVLATPTHYGQADSWRRVYSPYVFDMSEEVHLKKINSIIQALQYGPLTATVFSCGTMRYDTEASLSDFRGCPTEFAEILRHVPHRVAIVGYERTASLDSSYFIVHNSWGTTWGVNGGFARFSMSHFASRYYGEVQLFLVRTENQLFNPKQPSWSDADAQLETGDFRLPGDVPCNNGFANSCAIAKGVEIALPLPLGSEPSPFAFRASKYVVFDVLRMTIAIGAKAAVSATSVALRLATKEPNMDWNNRTVTVKTSFTSAAWLAKADDKLVWRSASVIVPLDVVNPLGRLEGLAIIWASNAVADTTNGAKILMTNFRLTGLNERQSLNFVKDDQLLKAPTADKTGDVEEAARVFVTSTSATTNVAFAAIVLSAMFSL